ncbi:MAG: ATP-binding protein [Planctomycetes bacterium]|nr:ATP-binding protein [Planctomycetota bacterium]
MQPPLRIYLVGAHATGKTTLARWIRDNYGLPMISEVARGVLAEMEAQLGGLRSNIDLIDRYQRQVFERQLEAEAAQPGSFVSDRAFCNLAYAGHHATILGDIAGDPRLAGYMKSVRAGLVFFLRPHRELIVEDGVRAGLEWEEVVRIDGMVKLLLEMFRVPYIPVESLSMQERVRLFERVLDLAGLQKKGADHDDSENGELRPMPRMKTPNGAGAAHN